MSISVGESVLIIAVCALCTFAERLLPFVVFGRREVPSPVRYLGKMLPLAVMATLVVYCLRHISFSEAGLFLPQLICVAVMALLHLWKSNTMLSVVCGTVLYMVLVQAVF